MLKDLNLDHYPKEKTHYLAYALQFGLKPPSNATMRRSEKKNQVKAGVNKKEDDTGVHQLFMRKKRGFRVPLRYDKDVFKDRRFRRRNRLINNTRKKVKKGKVKPAYKKGMVFPPRKPISIPDEI